MFGYRRLILVCLICIAGLAACVSPNPPAPVNPTPAPIHGYHITLYDENGNVSQRYDVGPSDIVRDDPLHQNIWFRVSGQERHFHGSYQKDRYYSQGYGRESSGRTPIGASRTREFTLFYGNEGTAVRSDLVRLRGVSSIFF